MKNNPVFYKVTVFTKHFFSSEVKELIATVIATAMAETFQDLANCIIVFENPFSFQTRMEEGVLITNVSNHPDLAPRLHIQDLQVCGIVTDRNFFSKQSDSLLKEKLQKHSFLKNVVINY